MPTEDDVSSNAEELSFSGGFYVPSLPLPRAIPNPIPAPPPLDAFESDVAEGLCNALREFNDRLPYLGRLWTREGMTSAELNELRAASDRSERTACAGGPMSREMVASLIDAGAPLDRAIARFEVANGLSEAEARTIWGLNTQFEAQRLMNECGGTPEAESPFTASDPEHPFGPQCSSPNDASSGSASASVGAACIRSAVAETFTCGSVVTDDEDESPDSGMPAGDSSDAEEDPGFTMEVGEASDPREEAVRQRARDLSEKLTRWVETEEEFREDSASAAKFSAYLMVVAGALAKAGGSAAVPLAVLVGIVGAVIGLTVTALQWASVHHERELSAVLEQAQQLAEDVGNDSGSGWGLQCLAFESGGNAYGYADPATGHTVDVASLLFQCFCNALAANSNGAELGPDVSCGNSELNTRRDCLLNPFGPDDNIRTECALLLEEDNSPWSGDGSGADAICQVLSCPSGMQSLAAATGSCACFEPLPPEQDVSSHCEAVLCPSGNDAIPMPDGSCNCNAETGDGGFDFGGGFDLPEDPITPIPGLPGPLPGPFPGF